MGYSIVTPLYQLCLLGICSEACLLSLVRTRQLDSAHTDNGRTINFRSRRLFNS